jgi:hypothetical protein
MPSRAPDLLAAETSAAEEATFGLVHQNAALCHDWSEVCQGAKSKISKEELIRE